MKKGIAAGIVLIILLAGYFVIKSSGDPQTSGVSPNPGENMVITPGEGVGELKFGMSFSDVEQILGEPDRELGRTYEYLDIGLAVSSSKPGKVAAFMFGDMNDPDSPLVGACKFRTAKGISMGSTLDDLIEAYGPPATTRNMGNLELVGFTNAPGATFALSNNKIIHMTFTK